MSGGIYSVACSFVILLNIGFLELVALYYFFHIRLPEFFFDVSSVHLFAV